EGNPQLPFRGGAPPPAVKASLEAATSKHERWEPTAEQLAAVRDGWDTIAPERLPLASIETTLSGADAIPEKLKADATVAGSLFAVPAGPTYQPRPHRPTRRPAVLTAGG